MKIILDVIDKQKGSFKKYLLCSHTHSRTRTQLHFETVVKIDCYQQSSKTHTGAFLGHFMKAELDHLPYLQPEGLWRFKPETRLSACTNNTDKNK